MNRTVARAGAGIVSAAVFLFAVCLIAGFIFGAYLVCMFLPIGYILMAAGLHHESGEDRRVAANAGMVFAGLYAALIFLVYFAQTTTVARGGLNEQAALLLDFSRGGLIFNYDLLGYGMMALSTFFLGLSMEPKGREDIWLKRLMLIHGAFFPGCFVMPMTGAFANMAGGRTSSGGVIALVIWCAYFLPIGILAWRHFRQPG